jgi:hypothetical protein
MSACITVSLALLGSAQALATTLNWSGYQWTVSNRTGGPGPNNFDDRNAWVDSNGYLHLKVANRNGVWSSAEIRLANPALSHFGLYQFHYLGNPAQLDKNLVLGFFHYPTADVGPDGTNEIDIEFSRWGQDSNPLGNWTVWHMVPNQYTSHRFELADPAGKSTHRYSWQPDSVDYQAIAGHVDAYSSGPLIAKWSMLPSDPAATKAGPGSTEYGCRSLIPAQCIAQKPQQFMINFWQFQGRVPSNGQEAEVVLTDFTYIPNGQLPAASCQVNAWDVRTSYPIGAYVRYGNTIYKAIYPSIATPPISKAAVNPWQAAAAPAC